MIIFLTLVLVGNLCLFIGLGYLIYREEPPPFQDTKPTCNHCIHSRGNLCLHPKNRRPSDHKPKWSQPTFREWDCKGKLFEPKTSHE